MANDQDAKWHKVLAGRAAARRRTRYRRTAPPIRAGMIRARAATPAAADAAVTANPKE